MRVGTWPGDAEERVVPPAPELVVGVPLVTDGVDVERRLVEVEAVRHTRRNDETGRSIAPELDERREARGR